MPNDSVLDLLLEINQDLVERLFIIPGLNNFFELMKLKNTLRHLRGEELITHLGLEYYD